MTLPESRLEARQTGAKYYSTGKPCIHGHLAKRKTCDGACYQCVLLRIKAYHARNRALGVIDWAKRNPEKRAETYRRNRKKNSGVRNALNAKRRANKLNATPPWLTKEELEHIKEFYIASQKISKETGTPHVVDHIIPLQNKDVSGLHVPWNLQIVTQEFNARKSNKLDFNLMI